MVGVNSGCVWYMPVASRVCAESLRWSSLTVSEPRVQTAAIQAFSGVMAVLGFRVTSLICAGFR